VTVIRQQIQMRGLDDMTAAGERPSRQGVARKSDRTRAAILKAAQAQFQRNGYDRTTIRSVAAAADIDPAMVMRYYGNKDGLFAAAVDVDLHLPDLTAVPARQRGRALLEHFVRRWEGDLSDDVLVLLLRSAVTDERAAQRLRAVFQEQLVAALSRTTTPEDALRRAGLLASQTLGLALGRYLLKLPGLADRPAEDVVSDLAPTIQRYLAGPLPPLKE
jgi:AcrR family transcriptional regulator